MKSATVEHLQLTCKSYEQIVWRASRGMTREVGLNCECVLPAGEPWKNRATVIIYDIPPGTPFNTVCLAVQKAGFDFFKKSQRVRFADLPAAY